MLPPSAASKRAHHGAQKGQLSCQAVNRTVQALLVLLPAFGPRGTKAAGASS